MGRCERAAWHDLRFTVPAFAATTSEVSSRLKQLAALHMSVHGTFEMCIDRVRRSDHGGNSDSERPSSLGSSPIRCGIWLSRRYPLRLAPNNSGARPFRQRWGAQAGRAPVYVPTCWPRSAAVSRPGTDSVHDLHALDVPRVRHDVEERAIDRQRALELLA